MYGSVDNIWYYTATCVISDQLIVWTWVSLIFAVGTLLYIRKICKTEGKSLLTLMIIIIKFQNSKYYFFFLLKAVQLFDALVNVELAGIEHVEDVVKELDRSIELARKATEGSHKTAKVTLKFIFQFISFPWCQGACSRVVRVLTEL